MSTTPSTPAPSATLPAQVTPAPGPVTGSYAAAPARASPVGGPAMSEDLGPACAELAVLIPALVPALSRDGTLPGGRAGLSPAAPSTPTSCMP